MQKACAAQCWSNQSVQSDLRVSSVRRSFSNAFRACEGVSFGFDDERGAFDPTLKHVTEETLDEAVTGILIMGSDAKCEETCVRAPDAVCDAGFSIGGVTPQCWTSPWRWPLRLRRTWVSIMSSTAGAARTASKAERVLSLCLGTVSKGWASAEEHVPREGVDTTLHHFRPHHSWAQC